MNNGRLHYVLVAVELGAWSRGANELFAGRLAANILEDDKEVYLWCCLERTNNIKRENILLREVEEEGGLKKDWMGQKTPNYVGGKAHN